MVSQNFLLTMPAQLAVQTTSDAGLKKKINFIPFFLLTVTDEMLLYWISRRLSDCASKPSQLCCYCCCFIDRKMLIKTIRHMVVFFSLQVEFQSLIYTLLFFLCLFLNLQSRNSWWRNNEAVVEESSKLVHLYVETFVNERKMSSA